MTHVLGPALRTTTIHDAWTVHKDYDGEAADGPVFAICATKELADEVRVLLRDNDPNSDSRDEDAEEDERFVEVPWPCNDGFEHAAMWVVEKSEEPKEKIATTLEEALAQFVGG